MKVILREDIAGVGRRGDILTVADGYARNFLLPLGKGLVASDGAISQAAAMRKARDLREAADRGAAQTIATELASKTIIIKAKSGAEGRLFGSVTTADIASALAAQINLTIDRKKIVVKPIRTTGAHSAKVRLHADVECAVTLSVIPG
jgi:large subunit ribosomal protein L9